MNPAFKALFLPLFLVNTFQIYMPPKKDKKTDKLVVYQLFTRIFGNTNLTNKFYGKIEENGCGKLNDINSHALKSIKELGVSHVWFTGVIEHATLTNHESFGIKKDHPSVVKGIAGSPYAIKDYYDIDPDLAVDVKNRMQEFENLVKRTHEADLKVVIDFIPNHVARQYNSDAKPAGTKDFGEADDQTKAFLNCNNFYYLPGQYFNVPDGVNPPVTFDKPYYEYPAKATGNDVFSEKPGINDWFETVKLNYGIDYQHGHTLNFHPIPDTWVKMRDILLFWSAKGVDAFRCDMAEMVPVEFWNWAIKDVKKQYPDILFIAEIYNPNNYKNYIFNGGFDYLYDKVGLYDSVRRLMEDRGDANDITRVWQNESGDFANHMLRFLENHDEQRITSSEFAGDQSKGPMAFALSMYLHTGPIMFYYGQELGVKPDKAEGFQGDDGRTTIFDYWGLQEMADWNNGGKWILKKLSKEKQELRKTYQEIVTIGLKSEAITEGQFYDLQYANNNGQSFGYDSGKIYSFIRFTKKQKLLFVFNFDHRVSQQFELHIPDHAYDFIEIDRKDYNLKNKQGEIVLLSKEGIAEMKLEPYSYRVFEIK